MVLYNHKGVTCVLSRSWEAFPLASSAFVRLTKSDCWALNTVVLLMCVKAREIIDWDLYYWFPFLNGGLGWFRESVGRLFWFWLYWPHWDAIVCQANFRGKQVLVLFNLWFNKFLCQLLSTLILHFMLVQLNSFPCSLPPQNSRVLSFLPSVFPFSFSLWHAKLFSMKVETQCLLQSSFAANVSHWKVFLCHFAFCNFCLWKTFLFVMEIVFLYSGINSKTVIKLMSSFCQLSKNSKLVISFFLHFVGTTVTLYCCLS